MEKFQVQLIRILTVSIFTFHCLSASTQSFSGGLIGGFTTSQVDGDEHSGFHRIGLYGGFHVERIHERNPWSHSFELSFAQKGAASSNRNFKTTIGYIDATYLFAIYPKAVVKSIQSENIRLKAGATMSAKVYENILFDDVKLTSKDFNRLDFQLCGGIDYKLLDSWLIEARTSYSLIANNQQYYNWTVYFALRWYFIS